MRIHFMHDWDHVTPEATTSYSGGTESTVAVDIGKAAVSAKAAREIKPEPEAPAKPKAEKATDGKG